LKHPFLKILLITLKKHYVHDMIITIAGHPGAGKTTVGQMIADHLGVPFYDMGTVRRRAAAERGMTIEEYNEYAKTHPETDREVDEFQTNLGKTESNFVIQGRTSFHFIPDSIKIFLSVEPHKGAQRIWHDIQNKKRTNEAASDVTLEDVITKNHARQLGDAFRYKTYYGIEDAQNPTNFDIVINTTTQTPVDTVKAILSFIQTL
jgi:cytidylate kinase